MPPVTVEPEILLALRYCNFIQMKYLFSLSVFFISFTSLACISASHKNLRISTESDPCLINSNNNFIHKLDTSTVDVDVVTNEIRNSQLRESILIARVIAMQGNRETRLKEILNLSCTQSGVAEIVINHFYSRLEEWYKPGQFKRLLKSKPKS